MPDESEFEQVYLDQKVKKHPDKESRDYELWQFHWTRLKKRKIVHYIQHGFDTFAEMAGKLIKSGVMNRLFSQFDFCSVQDRDQLSPRSAHLRKNRKMPPKCGKTTDIFGDVKWDFAYARDQDDDSSSEDESSYSSDSEDAGHGTRGFWDFIG